MERGNGTQFPFIIFHKLENRIIGSTRFLDIQEKHLKLEIGWTWLDPNYWGTAINLECKLLLLTFCFETLKTTRVQFKTDENNLRSRKAIEKIGGQFEGIFWGHVPRVPIGFVFYDGDSSNLVPEWGVFATMPFTDIALTGCFRVPEFYRHVSLFA